MTILKSLIFYKWVEPAKTVGFDGRMTNGDLKPPLQKI
jgi:hypothetical protein